ncbi:MAG: hypothetical protein NXI24_15320 [bacterium]|nr:hypothetical protein [bacterium]
MIAQLPVLAALAVVATIQRLHLRIKSVQHSRRMKREEQKYRRWEEEDRERTREIIRMSALQTQQMIRENRYNAEKNAAEAKQRAEEARQRAEETQIRAEKERAFEREMKRQEAVYTKRHRKYMRRYAERNREWERRYETESRQLLKDMRETLMYTAMQTAMIIERVDRDRRGGSSGDPK